MKITIDLPEPLFRRAKVLADRRGTSLGGLVIDGLRHVTGEVIVAETSRHGLPVLRRSPRGHRPKITPALVDRLREELAD